MCDLIQAGINIRENRGAEKAVDDIAIRFEDGGTVGIVFRLTGKAVPVVAIAEDNGVGLGKQKIGNRDIAERDLCLKVPASRLKCGLGDFLDIRAFVGLMRQLPDGFASVRARHTWHFAGVRPELLSAYPAGVVRHVRNPVRGARTLPLVVTTAARAKALFATWLLHRELPAANWACADRLAWACVRRAYSLLRFDGEMATTQRGGNLGLMFWGLNPVLATVNVPLVDKGRAVRMGAWVLWTWHISSTLNRYSLP